MNPRPPTRPYVPFGIRRFNRTNSQKAFWLSSLLPFLLLSDVGEILSASIVHRSSTPTSYRKPSCSHEVFYFRRISLVPFKFPEPLSFGPSLTILRWILWPLLTSAGSIAHYCTGYYLEKFIPLSLLADLHG
jgi:hypothetical protein